jgi:hypothetical protein
MNKGSASGKDNIMRMKMLAAAMALWAAAIAAEAVQEAAEDFDRFEDNLAMESERQFLTMNFADFTAQFPKTPDLTELLSRAGLLSESATFGKRTGVLTSSSSSSSRSSAAAATENSKEEYLLSDENQSRKTNVTLGPETRKSGKTDLGTVVSQLLRGGQRVEDMHEELSGLLFGGQPHSQAGGGCNSFSYSKNNIKLCGKIRKVVCNEISSYCSDSKIDAIKGVPFTKAGGAQISFANGNSANLRTYHIC